MYSTYKYIVYVTRNTTDNILQTNAPNIFFGIIVTQVYITFIVMNNFDLFVLIAYSWSMD